MGRSAARPADAAVARRASVWDLDGTILRTDIFLESAFRLIVKRPLLALPLAVMAVRSRSACKGWVARRSDAAASLWPVRPEALELISSARAGGEKILLATAAHTIAASQVVQYLGCFDAVLASSDTCNLKGRTKYLAIAQWLTDQGCDEFTYAGNSFADIPVWQHAANAIVVEPTHRLEKHVRDLGKPLMVLGSRPRVIRAACRAMRLHQWTKNLLLFVPLLAGHRFDIATVLHALAAFLSFSMAASAVYVFNDLTDLEADRSHPTKRARPLACGDLPLQGGFALMCALASASLVIGLAFLPWTFTGVVLGYLITNVVYSARFKTEPIVDVMVLSSMYGVRLYAGGVATGVELSAWLMAFSMFLFLSLAFAKRYAEVRRVSDGGQEMVVRRGYSSTDKDLLAALGISAGYVSVLVLALYMNSDQMRSLYGESHVLWLTCPLALLWITRLWFVAHRGQLNEDPVLFALRDRLSVVIGIVAAALFVIALIN